MNGEHLEDLLGYILRFLPLASKEQEVPETLHRVKVGCWHSTYKMFVW